MIEKEKLLEAWIMVEHLSEGDINIRKPEIKTLDNLQEQDFYSLFQSELVKTRLISNKKSGFVVYFDVFSFTEVISILRKKYNLRPTDEELNIGMKFSFALYFDKNFNYQQDMTFFTESAYIRYKKEVPYEKEFRKFEEDFKKQLSQNFEETAAVPEKFNTAIQKVITKYRIDIKNCRMQLLKNIETDATNLHSFFIDDLEKAKNIDTPNLDAYMYGEREGRVNLDSKRSSANFDPDVFEQILQPQNYPLGRFPSNTKYALSLMQQVAVNLSVGVDNRQMRSVNGPPGTGKTTLLKDIFAQLIVNQAYDIAKLSDHFIKGTSKTIYFDHASIGMLPKHITENSIVVASSNNGAVQNIVNELPLKKEIDQELLKELVEADYFKELSNSRVHAEWKEDENGKKKEELTSEAGGQEENFWGLFSLEGGKADNVSNILTNMKLICKYLEEKYTPEKDVYKDFLKQYEKVEKLRKEAQRFAEDIQHGEECIDGMKQEHMELLQQLEKAKSESEAEIEDLKSEQQRYKKQMEHLQEESNGIKNRTVFFSEQGKRLDAILEELKIGNPGLLAGRSEKEKYRERLNRVTEQILQFGKDGRECFEQGDKVRSKIRTCQAYIEQLEKEQREKRDSINTWSKVQKCKISELENSIDAYEECRKNNESKILNMYQEYEDLQLTNPWFDEAYRIEQSKLFILALRVRKQFLYENRKNIKAATVVWNQQEKYLEKKVVIEAAWHWINMTIPVISSTFASFSRMCRNLGAETLGHLFIDEAGQALPQAAVGAIYRSRHVMVVGDPSQIKPVLTLDSNSLQMLGTHFGVTEKYLSASASVQTLVDAVSQYGFYRSQEREEDSWIGIPLWVHRRCRYPMFTISNKISYDGLMVQGVKKNGKAKWYDVSGKARNKYVEEQGEFLLQKIQEMAKENPKIMDKNEKDMIYVITPFSYVAFQLIQKLKKINFIRYGADGKATNVGTVHTFQGKEAPIVFFVLGADSQSRGAARWAMSEANIMNVAATRAKEEFYIIGDRKLYLKLGCDVATDTEEIIRKYEKDMM